MPVPTLEERVAMYLGIDKEDPILQEIIEEATFFCSKAGSSYVPLYAYAFFYRARSGDIVSYDWLIKQLAVIR